MLRSIGATELIVLAVVVLILFGGKKLPEFARGISKASQEFTKGLKGDEKDSDEEDKK